MLEIPSEANTLLCKVSARQQLPLADGFPCNFSPECCGHDRTLPLDGLQASSRQSLLFLGLISLGRSNIFYTLFRVCGELNLRLVAGLSQVREAKSWALGGSLS